MSETKDDSVYEKVIEKLARKLCGQYQMCPHHIQQAKEVIELIKTYYKLEENK